MEALWFGVFLNNSYQIAFQTGLPLPSLPSDICRNHNQNLGRGARFHLDDLDAAMALMAKMADLYPRLANKQQTILLQILAKQIIVNPHGEIIEYDLNSPFVYLRSLAQGSSTPRTGKVVRNMSDQGY